MLTTGKDLYVRYGSVIFSTNYRIFNQDDEVALVDQSGHANRMRTYVADLEQNTISIESLQEAGGMALWAACAPGSEDTLAWTWDSQIHSVAAVVKSRKRTLVHDDIVKLSVTFGYTDQPAVTAATGPESLITLGIGSDAQITWLVLTGLHAEAV